MNDNFENEILLKTAIRDHKQAARGLFFAPHGKYSTFQYAARWIPKDGGKAVIVGDRCEILAATALFMEMGATKIEIEVVQQVFYRPPIHEGPVT